MTKVLITDSAFNIGGSLTSIELVVRQGMEEGMSFEALSAIDISSALPKGVRYGRIKVLNKWPVAQWVYYRYFAAQAFGIFQRLLLGRHDVVILNNGLFSNAAGQLAAGILRRPVIQLARGMDHSSKIGRIFKNWPTAYVAVSGCVRDHLVNIGVPEEKIVLAPEGIGLREEATITQKQALREKLGISENARVVGFVGRLDFWKGYDLFVDAVLKAMTDDPLLHAVIVGGPDVNEVSKVAALQEVVARHFAGDRVHFVGEVMAHEVEGYIRGMDVMLHTSVEAEPFGRVLLEAMAVGVPVISSSEGGPREIIIDGISGILTEPNDVDGLTAAISWVYETDDRLPALSAGALDRVRETYSEDVCAAPVLELIRSYAKKDVAMINTRNQRQQKS